MNEYCVFSSECASVCVCVHACMKIPVSCYIFIFYLCTQSMFFNPRKRKGIKERKRNKGNKWDREKKELKSVCLYVVREREMFYLTMRLTHFIYGYMASDIWLRTILIVRKETCCRHMGYSYRLTARVLLYAPSHRQDSIYHNLCYTSRGALVGTRNTDIWNLNNKIYGVNEKGGNKRKGIKERKRNKGKNWDREKKVLKSISLFVVREKNVLFNNALNTFYLRFYLASDIWLRTILIVRKETHRQDNTYYGLCYTSHGALAGTRNSSMGPPHEGSIRRPTAPWANALTTELHLAPLEIKKELKSTGEIRK